ncbi:hypothetical protein HBI56_062240 [Parastagonospora nodorum]|uniref:Uncharacterized protein n=1 Tax=Phaeosphaeria nodorum (strain SN15 / ATCC MYA-4574 / FGSC 10173) TaxID=321614 RepID=A0A7U2F2I9_PHANO|nr:hypothetical protein HBH56_156310 [Parastagonospora nodorum]QRC97554.1 hypothetical protein JI435_410750 [Parastagonospora nodorum SN15]KAH3922945.1 hypothetical protein HBH54_218410 [Parastagonospora nodorum]KAH3969528.1 hypothetical protein HBH52_173560 [Parastagonospora nodorum]KAH4002325.1 hypothetical protein HBI10_075100 [Parastagonospora nodorum]
MHTVQPFFINSVDWEASCPVDIPKNESYIMSHLLTLIPACGRENDVSPISALVRRSHGGTQSGDQHSWESYQGSHGSWV